MTDGWLSAFDCDCGIAACYANGLALARLGLLLRYIQPPSYPQGIFLIICCFTLSSYWFVCWGSRLDPTTEFVRESKLKWYHCCPNSTHKTLKMEGSIELAITENEQMKTYGFLVWVHFVLFSLLVTIWVPVVHRLSYQLLPRLVVFALIFL